MTQKNEVARKGNEVVKSALVKYQELYIASLVDTFREMSLSFDAYQSTCAMTAISSMYALLAKEGLTFNDIDQNNVADILRQVTMLKINIAAVPSEGYLIVRNVKVGKLADGKDKWVKQFEFNLEGDGNDKLLREFGVDIKKVHPYWIVREGDEFTYPTFEGLNLVPPKWGPKGYTAKVIRVVYPIEYNDGSVVYYTAEREEVVRNLQAHISNNIKMKKEEDMTWQAKQELQSKISNMSLEEILSNAEILKLGSVSPSWKDAHSREAMILRKMRNNAIKKHPRSFDNAYLRESYEKTYEDYDQYRDSRIDIEAALDAEVKETAMTESIEVPDVKKEIVEVELVTEDDLAQIDSEDIVPF